LGRTEAAAAIAWIVFVTSTLKTAFWASVVSAITSLTPITATVITARLSVGTGAIVGQWIVFDFQLGFDQLFNVAHQTHIGG
jgi:hypothetical protein